MNTLGVTRIHPQEDPVQWPPPLGQNVHVPLSNCLRKRFQDIEDYSTQYELLINRAMIHKCTLNYCLKKKGAEYVCRFKFPMHTTGFSYLYGEENADGNADIVATQIEDKDAIVTGAKLMNKEVSVVSNHPWVVHNISELLLIWCANIECSLIKSYKHALKYLLKYISKPEPNSPFFKDFTKAIINNCDPNTPVKTLFQKILMKTIGSHDLSRQESYLIMSGNHFMEYSREFVCLNVCQTRKINVNANLGEEIIQNNMADKYWNRENNPQFKKLVQNFEDNPSENPLNPRSISLYDYARNYTPGWKWHGKEKVPHITPNFNKIPKKTDLNTDRYFMFLRTILLTFKPGTTYTEIYRLNEDESELQRAAFVQTEECPIMNSY